MNSKKPSKEVIEEFQKSEYWPHRLKFYETFGFTEEAFDDNSAFIREESYKALGFTKDALFDKNHMIRFNAYVHFGFDEKAFYDESPLIRFNAYKSFGCIKNISSFTTTLLIHQQINYIYKNQWIIIAQF